MRPLELLALLASSAGAGVMNALAGGGTILTFPTLILLGVPAIQANATSTVALLPGAAASMAGYRREVATHRAWLKTLFLPSLVGGAHRLGPPAEDAREALREPRAVPRPLRDAPLPPPDRPREAEGRRRGPRAARPDDGPLAAWRRSAQLAVAVYGGYFGAGIGILMLVVLGFLGLTDIHAMNGLKNFFGISINGVAAAFFLSQRRRRLADRAAS